MRIIIYIIIILGAICLTSCSNKKEMTCVNVETNLKEDISEALGMKMIVEIYSDYIKFTNSYNDNESGVVKIIDDKTVKILSNKKSNKVEEDVIINWYIPYIHKVWNIKKITFYSKKISKEEYVNLYFE